MKIPGAHSLLCNYEIQLTVAVDNPVDNVRKIRKKGGYIFEVPINYPNIHNVGLTELFEAVERGANVHTVHNP